MAVKRFGGLQGLLSSLSRGLHVGCRLQGQQVDPPLIASKLKSTILPFSDFLTDKHGRQHDYLRISISERWLTSYLSLINPYIGAGVTCVVSIACRARE